MKNKLRLKQVIVFLVALVLVIVTGCDMDNRDVEQNENSDDTGMTMIEMISNRDFIGPDDVSSIKKDIYVGIKKSFRVFEPLEDIEYYIATNKAQKRKLEVEISLSSDFLNYTVKNKHQILVSDGNQTISGKISSEKSGILSFKIVLKDEEGKAVMNDFKNIAVMKKAENPSQDNFIWGVQPFLVRAIEYGEGKDGNHCFVGMTAEETYKRVWEFIEATGANLVRDGTIWATNQPIKGSGNFGLMTRFADDSKDKGVTVDWHLGGTPDWAVREEYKNAPVKWNKMPTLDAWEDYLDSVLKTYKSYDKIMFEIINECNWPDFLVGNADDYLNILQTSFNKIQAADPNAVVINGGMVMPHANHFVTEEGAQFKFEEDYKFYEKYAELYKAGKTPYIAYHSHQQFKGFIEVDAVNLRRYMIDNGMPESKVYLNESGNFNADGMKQLEDVIKKALWTKANNHEGYVLFNFRDIEGGILSPPGWGVITRDGQPKETYVAYANAINMLSGYKTTRVLANTLYNAYIMGNGKNSIVLTFRDKNVADTTLTVNTSKKYKAYDMFGNEIAEYRNVVGNYPVYLVFDGKIDEGEVSISVPSGHMQFLSELPIPVIEY